MGRSAALIGIAGVLLLAGCGDSAGSDTAEELTEAQAEVEQLAEENAALKEQLDDVVATDSAPPTTQRVAETYEAPIAKAIRDLWVRKETPSGFTRDQFTKWVDLDGDCLDTRAEVLFAENTATTLQLRNCIVARGRWPSYYDGKSPTRASGVVVDHLVPLQEAWASGAKKWDGATRRRFANDLVDGRTLAAVTITASRAKGNDDPAKWLPAKGKCRYIKEWAAVKHRWALAVDEAEKAALTRALKKTECAGQIKVRRAVIGAGG
jgi:outer membrane murein-binding lipoprotein Lpp